MPVFELIDEIFFPPVELAEPNGLLAMGGDLSPDRLLAAYQKGIFPWYNQEDPLLWWFTSPRMVLVPHQIHIPKRISRYYRKFKPTISFDSDFSQVINQCATIRNETEEGTWLQPEMIEAYIHLHKLGYAHSVECWQEEKMVGGLYGIALDRIFFGESMFSRITSGSHFALIALAKFLAAQNYLLIDCQMTTQHLLRFGAKEIDQKSFTRFLQMGITNLKPQHWKTP